MAYIVKLMGRQRN